MCQPLCSCSITIHLSEASNTCHVHSGPYITLLECSEPPYGTKHLSVHIYPGVNIFQNKWIFHPGKVSHFGPFGEEFPYFVIRACCRKLSFLTFLCRRAFPGRETLTSMAGKPFPVWENVPCIINHFPGSETIP